MDVLQVYYLATYYPLKSQAEWLTVWQYGANYIFLGKPSLLTSSYLCYSVMDLQFYNWVATVSIAGKASIMKDRCFNLGIYNIAGLQYKNS